MLETVWVLSEESPFENPEVSGGCVCGVFATLAAALFELGTWEIGLEGMAELTWTAVTDDHYKATGHGTTVYILRRHVIQDDTNLREARQGYEQRHALSPHPYRTLDAQALQQLILGDVLRYSEPSC